MGIFFSKPEAVDTAEALRRAGIQVLSPGQPEYEERNQSYWSNSAKLSPRHIVQPRDAGEVSTVIKRLVAAGEVFAVRSGGHTQWAGSNNIRNGITIDLGRLDWARFDVETETVDIGPGGRWRDVYTKLAPHGRVVAGGREGNVGVAGLILGGGNTFYTARHGFACDNVVSFEVVLADGRIVTASSGDADAQNSELFWALKGGSNNFGIVTNFRMRAIKSGPIWGGLTFYPPQVTEPAIEALVDFTSDIHKDVDSNMLCFFAYTVSPTALTTPQFKGLGIATLFVQTAGVEKAPAYNKFLGLPSVMSTYGTTTVVDLVSSPQNNLPTDYHDIWFTATFKNDARIVRKAVELHEKLVGELQSHIADGDFWTQCLFQPLPKLFGENSARAGGNAMGVERQETDGLLFQAAAMVRTPEQEAFAYPKIKAWLEAVREFAAAEVEGGGLLDWVYLNYADRSQNPLGSYGPANLKRLRDVAVRYDPDGVFQKLCPGGFKISSIRAD
ncbi:hypothetical protein F5Y17DRAFT_468321 [Xylariaceae sp. FL0594]|nr:hypothetical protein F5Y17DRAFT_468321 [Xylariaceae sp. FL0594]